MFLNPLQELWDGCWCGRRTAAATCSSTSKVGYTFSRSCLQCKPHCLESLHPMLLHTMQRMHACGAGVHRRSEVHRWSRKFAGVQA